MPVLAVSFLAMAVTSIYNYGFAGGADVHGGMGLFFTVVIFVIALGPGHLRSQNDKKRSAGIVEVDSA